MKVEGRNASPAHVFLQDTILHALWHETRRVGFDCRVSDEKSPPVRGLPCRPDLWAVRGDEAYPIEIGRVDPDKWGDRPFIHVTFYGRVGIYNGTGTPFELALVASVTTIANYLGVLMREDEEDDRLEEALDP
jgi:hypothetical protein